MKLRKALAAAGFWIGAVTIPHLLKIVSDPNGSKFGGKIITLHNGLDGEVGTYIFPNAMFPHPSVFKELIKPKNHDLKFVDYGRDGYNPDAAGREVAEDVIESEYQKIQIISFSMGDQLIRSVGSYLEEWVDRGDIEIVSIDSLPNPEFIDEKILKIIHFMFPLLSLMRTLGGWVAELPIIFKCGQPHSFAELVENLGAIKSFDYDYTRRSKAKNCIVSAVRDGNVFYEPNDTEEMFVEYFGDSYDYNPGASLCKIGEHRTASSYRKIFRSCGFEF